MPIHYQRLAKTVILTAFVAAMLFTVLVAAEAKIPTQIVPKECTSGAAAKCTVCHIGIMITNATEILIYIIALPSSVALIAAGGIMLLVSGGSETTHKRGVQILTHTIIGLIIVVTAWLAVDSIIKVLVTGGGKNFVGTFGPWNKLPVGACDI